MKVRIIALVAAAIVLIGLAAVRGRQDRSQEGDWAHGGDQVAVDVDVALATAETFSDVTTRLGVPPGTEYREPSVKQNILVRLRWSGLTSAQGSLILVTVDARRINPVLLAAHTGWSATGRPGARLYNVEPLARHYGSLKVPTGLSGDPYRFGGSGSSADRSNPNGPITIGARAGVGIDAADSGALVASFYDADPSSYRFHDLARELIVILAYVDEQDQMRWARRIYG